MNTYTVIEAKNQKPFDGLITTIPKALAKARAREGYRSSMPAPKPGGRYAKTKHTQREGIPSSDLRSSSINPKRWGN